MKEFDRHPVDFDGNYIPPSKKKVFFIFFTQFYKIKLKV
jgi:hypothetical protein